MNDITNDTIAKVSRILMTLFFCNRLLLDAWSDFLYSPYGDKRKKSVIYDKIYRVHRKLRAVFKDPVIFQLLDDKSTDKADEVSNSIDQVRKNIKGVYVKYVDYSHCDELAYANCALQYAYQCRSQAEKYHLDGKSASRFEKPYNFITGYTEIIESILEYTTNCGAKLLNEDNEELFQKLKSEITDVNIFTPFLSTLKKSYENTETKN